MKRFWRKAENPIYALMSLTLLALYVLAVHDRQTSEGVGLYLALACGREDRRLFDIGADVVRLLVFLFLLLLPCVLLQYRRVVSIFRMLTAWLAFLPFADASKLVHILFDLRGTVSVPVSAADMLWQGAAGIFAALGCFLPVTALLLFGWQQGEREEIKCEKIRIPIKNLRIIWSIQLLMIVLVFALPALAEIWLFVLLYLLLVQEFAVTEELCLQNERWNDLSFWLFFLFWLRGIYRLAEVLSTSRL